MRIFGFNILSDNKLQDIKAQEYIKGNNDMLKDVAECIEHIKFDLLELEKNTWDKKRVNRILNSFNDFLFYLVHKRN